MTALQFGHGVFTAGGVCLLVGGALAFVLVTIGCIIMGMAAYS